MTAQLTCKGCYRPARTHGIPLEAAPDTILISNGRCRRCKRNGDGNTHAALNSPVNVEDFDPHRIAVEAGRPLNDLVLFPAPMFSKQFPVECRFCSWTKVAPTHLLARTWAYKHFNKYV